MNFAHLVSWEIEPAEAEGADEPIDARVFELAGGGLTELADS